ncbi:serine/threonine protein kinase [Roseiconus nitratireducens]|uniref:non-specific serine/threonine protein kinase n=1 Tax=Roseiconus nitratireducens TaxID=2605748 RepID=A0A5M6DIM6_9BACT|nr:serine/threonine-protein kinase [Roseiconus nitratireducens]KAA5546090.1 serine/threonine protein kinase [Roseiconus nitratireducens]
MDSNDPSATDQTVHRRIGAGSGGDGESASSQKLNGGDFAIDGLEEGLQEAQTVIKQTSDSNRRESKPVGRTPAEVAKVLVGQTLNQYFLDQMIGGGGMGAVFRAHDQQLDRVVALKVIPFVGNDPELQRRFRNEAQNAAKLDHPRIARIFDAGSHGDWHYIVFEYIQGTNLRDLIQSQGPLTLDDAVFYTAQVAEAIDHASQRGIVHRDIKPSNVLIADDGSVKLVDMGLARSDNLDLSEDMTASGVTLGTFDYISPEQALDPRDADVRSDLYSLGCTFYFMLTGEAPYHGGTMLQKLLSHGNAPLPNPQSLRKDLPDEFVAVVHRMMAKEPKARYQNASDLLADLNELAFRFQLKRSKATAAIAPPPINEGLQRLQTHLPWMIAVLLVLMIAGYLELQSTAINDSFAVERRSGMVTDTSTGFDDDSGGSAIRNASGGSTSSRGDAAQGPASPTDEASGSESEVSSTDSLAGDPTEQRRSMQSSDSERIAASAAKPPPLVDELPLPIADRDSEDGDGRSPAMSEINPSVGPASEKLSGDGSNAAGGGPAETAIGSIGSAVDTPESDPVGGLPAPEAVRIVPQSLLALAQQVDQVDRDTDGAILASTLPDALDLAMRFGVLRVEFATAEIVTGPVSLPSDNMSFVSTVGRTSVRMVSTDPMAIGRSELLNIGNNRARFENLDFQWELTGDQVDGGAMFVVNDNRLVRFSNCTFTLVNRANHDRVVFFQIVTDPEALPESDTLPGRIFNPNERALPLVAIQLDDCIARGEATFISMDYAVALQLVWNNGLLAINGRLIETFGARVRPPMTSGPMQLALSNVTAEIPGGLIRMRLGPSGVFPVPIERQANQCVFLVDEGQPHVEIAGTDTLASPSSLLTWRGEENAYVVTPPTLSDPLLLISDLEGNSRVTTMADLQSDRLTWSSERSPGWSVYWSMPRSSIPAYHRRTPADYRQDGAVVRGFDEADLPPLP